jgi:hypothetical protein
VSTSVQLNLKCSNFLVGINQIAAKLYQRLKLIFFQIFRCHFSKNSKNEILRKKCRSHITPQIRVPNRGPKSWSHITPQIGVPYHPPNQGPKSEYHITPKSGSLIGVTNRGPKSGSQIRVPNRGPKWGSQIGVLNRGPKSESHYLHLVYLLNIGIIQ